MALFRNKMRNWKPGRPVRLKPIVVDGKLLELVVYPNGINPDNCGYVSISVINHNSEDLELDTEFRLKETIIKWNLPLKPGQACGSDKFFPHANLFNHSKRKWNTLDESSEDEDEFEVGVLKFGLL